ncbi:ABC transporter permease [Rathayibacter sp. VKM Ac-2760]|uniref:ABC transporter permease n=1 Tax=Rathayibacter sp. VKM Ac-2760 TaxID=2609253 RepID=UPI0013167CD9|nr:ABC transporter permease [Rathayibacter sp. VKM Ac-2760]QHC60169.1 ABC transporter permease subunit [Rathayibacter sp. VKM Ac-2760]
MLGFLLKRIGTGVALLLAATAVAFLLLGARPDSIARSILGQSATQEQVAQRVVALGLDRPLPLRYLDWLGSALSGDFGRSWFTNESVIGSLSTRLPVTLSVVTGVIVLSAIVAFALGTLGAVRRGGVDSGVQVATVLGYGLPGFLVALVLVTVFGVQLGWFPALGYVPPAESLGGWLSTITLPIIALSIATIASVTQQVRSAVGAELRKEYVRTLRSRGVSERRILLRYVLRGAAGPGLTVLALEFVGLLGGAVVVESVFALPGVGAMAVQYVPRGDIPVIMGLVVVTVGIVVVVNTAIDLVVAWLNPRARTA